MGRVFRMACTCGSPGWSKFSNKTLASCAATGVAPVIHFPYTSPTSVAWPSGLLTGLAQRLGNPACEMIAGEPVYLAQFAGSLSSPGSTLGLPLEPVIVAPPMMLLIARAATCRLSTGLSGL